MSDFFPEDVVVDVLSRLPTKSLIRFRSVSKLWNSLITSPNLINSQLNQSLTNPKNSYDNLPLVIVRQCDFSYPTRLEHYKLFIDTGDDDKTFDEYLEIPFPLKSRCLNYYFLMGYVKGLFCFFELDKYFLWNPSIRRSICLPKPGITKKTHGHLLGYLGFGFDSRSNDYKVVRVVILCGGTRSEEVPLVEVYSLNLGSWKVSSGAGDSFPPGCGLEYPGHPSAFLEGALHFVAHHRRNWGARLICSFDLGREVFKTMSLPNGLATTEMRTIVFMGSLSLLCHDGYDRANKFCSIWIMKEYGVVDSWYKYANIDLTGGIIRVVGIRKNGHILLEGKTPRHWKHWELSSYDPLNKEIKMLGILGVGIHFHVDTYEENLILLNKINDPVSRMGWSRKRKDRCL
ncbi:F-box protein At3g07870-like [Rhododendron vialii]|uniref:F-box protein At3g07870-like n=1 Tax=Rhododendron vialii TaxID=182163 RepID=UPI00265D8703|nr:F-box protein At3g07870-like [Rhododendron vialii]